MQSITKNSNAIINANSPNMNIRFEYIPEDYKQFYGDERDKLTNGCTGMSFGIIERPHVIITLTKKIKTSYIFWLEMCAFYSLFLGMIIFLA